MAGKTLVNTHGFSLIEVLIAIAIVAIITAIAIPAYNSYMEESRLSVMRLNLSGMRVALEDHRLDNGEYGVDGETYNNDEITDLNGWEPDGGWNADPADNRYNYGLRTYIADGRPTYDVWAVNTAFNVWYRCDDRMNTCCDGTGAVAACN